MDQHQNTYIYKYDAFNQLNNAVYGSFKPKTPGTLENNTLALSNNFKVDNITYDDNGNIETLDRHDQTGVLVDHLVYNYKDHPITGERINQLDHVTDYGSENQSGENYTYDESGRLIEDKQENIRYEYNVQGLVTNVYQLLPDPNKRIIRFTYDDGGFRYKKEHFNLSTGLVEKTTLYVRDASGQVTSIYDLETSTSNYKQEEIPFYGTSRIGSLHKNTTLASDDAYYYELKDHLGNIRQTIKVEGSSETWANHKSDYYPFGMKLLNPASNINSYRYGYQGEYAEDETLENGIKANSFQLRLYNPKFGRWLNPDPYGQFNSPYLAMGNTPVNGVDPDGGWFKEWKVNTKTGEKTFVSNMGGDETEFIHYYGGGNALLDGTTEVTDLCSGECQSISASTRGDSFIMDYVKRNDNVNWYNIADEFITGHYPENSLFYGDHPMNEDIQKSPVFLGALNKFKETDMTKKGAFSSKFGLIGAWRAGDNMTAQMLGKFTTSFYPIGEKVVVLITDSKSNNSFNPIFKFSAWLTDQPEQHNKVRDYGGKYPPALSNTRQTYLFILSNHGL